MKQKKLIGITSPPYEDALGEGKSGIDWNKASKTHKRIYTEKSLFFQDNYSENPSNIGNIKGNETDEDFDITKYHSCLEDLYWYGCYDSEILYKQFITPESYSHPAKASFLLVERIFRHLEKLGLLTKDMTVCDFMAGSSRIPLLASLRGYNSIAVELEPHFIKMSEDNKKHCEKKIARKLNMQVIQGDSRKLSNLLSNADVGVVSPPYEESITRIRKSGANDLLKNKWFVNEENQAGYSSNPQNIGNLKDKPIVGITSPPYVAQSGGHNVKGGHIDEGLLKRSSAGRTGDDRYTPNKQNISQLKDNQIIGVTSPPYDNRLKGDNPNAVGQKVDIQKQIENMRKKGFSEEQIKNNLFMCERGGHYSENIDNIGNKNAESYLQAMLKVYKEASKIMPIMVTITKNPTRAGKLRRLDLDTARLLEMAGYKIIDYHRAVLFKENAQQTLTGEIKKEYKGRLSFFKRLSLQKGNVASMWEDIIIAKRI